MAMRKLRNDLCIQSINDQCIVILPYSGKMFTLNTTAGWILELIDQSHNDEEIIRAFKNRFGLSADDFSQDYADLISQFESFGFFEKEPETKILANQSSKMGFLHSDEFRGEIKKYCQDNYIPLQAFFELTYGCNLECKHCYIPNELPKNRLGIDDYKRLVDELKEMGCLEIILTGGECLLNPLWMEICEYIRKKRLSFVVKSNAVLLNDRNVDILKRYAVSEVQISLYSMDASIHDGFTKKPGSHSATIAAIKKLKQAAIPVRISTVVTKSNFKHLKDLVAFSREENIPIGFDLVVTRSLDSGVNPLDERLGERELKWLDSNKIMKDVIFDGSMGQPSEIYQEDVKYYYVDDFESPICGAGNTVMAISPDGEIRPCITYPVVVGNIFERSLKDIWWKPNAELQSVRNTKASDFLECEECSISDTCPRCPATISQETGSPTGKAEYICLIAEYFDKYGGEN